MFYLEDGDLNEVVENKRDSRLRPATVKSYNLNKQKAVRLKLNACSKPPGYTLKKSNKGQCVSISFNNTVEFKTFRIQLLQSCNGQIESRVDQLGAHVEDLVTCQGVTIHVYKTNNSCLVQGNPIAVENWMDNKFSQIYTSTQESIRSPIKSTPAVCVPQITASNSKAEQLTAEIPTLQFTEQYMMMPIPQANELPITDNITINVQHKQILAIEYPMTEDQKATPISNPESQVTLTLTPSVVHMKEQDSTIVISELPVNTCIDEALTKASLSTPSTAGIEPPSSACSTCCCQETVSKIEGMLRHSVAEIQTTLVASLKSELDILRREVHVLKEENASIKTSLLKLQRDVETGKATKSEDIATNQLEQTKKDESLQSVDNNITTRNPPTQVYPIDVRVSNRFDAIQTSDAENSCAAEMNQLTNRPSAKKTNDNNKKKQNQKRTTDRQVQHLIVGDSLLRGVFEDKMSTSSAEAVSVIPVPGANVERLTDKIGELNSSDSVRKVTIHVGINNVMSGAAISSGSLIKLKSVIQQKFRHADMFISSILPPSFGSQRHLVDKANTSLKNFCQHNSISFINNTPFFTSSSGAPKKNMYRDQIHTSKLGSSILAKNIKYPDRTSSRQLTHNHQAEAPRDLHFNRQGSSVKRNSNTQKQPATQALREMDKETYDVQFPPLTSREPPSTARIAVNIPDVNTHPAVINTNTDDVTHDRLGTTARPNNYGPYGNWNQELLHLMQFSPASLRHALTMSAHHSMYYMPYMNRGYQ